MTVENPLNTQPLNRKPEHLQVSNCAVSHEVEIPAGNIDSFKELCMDEKMVLLKKLSGILNGDNAKKTTFVLSYDIKDPHAKPCVFCVNYGCLNISNIE